MSAKENGPIASSDPELPPCDNLQERFDEASKLGIPPYNWVPPEWGKLKVENDKRLLPDNCEPDNAFFDSTQRTEQEVNAYVGKLGTAIEAMTSNSGAASGTVAKLASPLEDFSHVDPDQLSDSDISELCEPGGEPLRGRERLVGKLKTLAGSRSPGMLRLEVVFHWIVARFERLCARLNQTLDGESESDYTQLRDEYIERLRDLDDHEPQREKEQKGDRIRTSSRESEVTGASLSGCTSLQPFSRAESSNSG
jgi:hypothetical protein